MTALYVGGKSQISTKLYEIENIRLKFGIEEFQNILKINSAAVI